MSPARAHILAIDDTPSNLMTLGSVLEGEFELQFASSGPAGIALALKNPPDLILLDIMMPEVDGFETFRRLRAQPGLQSIPVIFVTALNDVNSEVTGLSLGAADYITKPINVSIARHRIRNLLEREQLRTELAMQRDLLEAEIVRRVQSEEHVRQLAFHDALTGLPNRRMLGDRLGQAMAASKRSGLHAALIYLDLDNFKPLNDAHGHDVGDLLLLEVARRLTDSVRETDTVVRLGGDEFVVMLSELALERAASAEQATGVAEEIRTALAEPYQLTLHGTDQAERALVHHCSASIGIAIFGGHTVSQVDLLKRADAAMYQAKAAGRNTIRLVA
ncbi:MAG: diguanylate cyclase [Rhodoferax sp.]|nr:diguanylate cyclase [Rhodoferax sp.]